MNQPPLHVLLADDDDDDRMIFKDALEEVRVKTRLTLVKDGIQLMDYLLQDDCDYPGIVFLDLNMPRKGGIECLREIRSDKRFNNISLAIYSTSASDGDIEDTFIKGANVYIRKPNDFASLVKILEDVITINWQYHNSDLNRENFVLSI
ncbi:MAG: response regulator [Saprospiraceae bacterium]|uniref:Response regulator n=1 Tax=Candidatus Opimibacter skivensis TaxID=2982028 RepID=A0A9D7SVN3_9BACT|nr:response regulator [Candidatus Opimibacter skivensis]